MTAKECAELSKAYWMLVDYIGADLVWWTEEHEGDHWNGAACLLQQLIAEYEEWT